MYIVPRAFRSRDQRRLRCSVSRVHADPGVVPAGLQTLRGLCEAEAAMRGQNVAQKLLQRESGGGHRWVTDGAAAVLFKSQDPLDTAVRRVALAPGPLPLPHATLPPVGCPPTSNPVCPAADRLPSLCRAELQQAASQHFIDRQPALWQEQEITGKLASALSKPLDKAFAAVRSPQSDAAVWRRPARLPHAEMERSGLSCP
jgi:hypothetical protein